MKVLEAANKVNRTFEKYMAVFPVLGVLLGIFLPRAFIDLRFFVPLLFGVITFSGALRLKIKQLGQAVSSPRPFILFFITAHVILPLAVLFLSKLIFGKDPDTVTGYVLLYSSPTAVTSFVWVSIFRGDLAFILAIILLNTIIAPLIVPGTIKLLLGASVSINLAGMVLTLLYMIVIPTIAGVAANELSRGKIPSLIGPLVSPFSKLCMVMVIAINTAAVSHLIHFTEFRTWKIISVCVVFNIMSFMTGKITALAGKLDSRKQTALFIASGLKNSTAAMTLAVEFFPAAAALPAVLGIMTQHNIAALIGRLLTGKSEGRGNEGQAGGPLKSQEPQSGN